MRFGSARRKSTAALCPMLCLACLTACSIPLDVRVTTDCAWFADQHFRPETKAWIMRDGEPPAHVREDLERVARNNEKAAEFCR